MQEWTPEQKKAYSEQMKLRFKILVPIFILGMLGMWILNSAMEYDNLLHPYIDGLLLGLLAYIIIDAVVKKRISLRLIQFTSDKAGYYVLLGVYIIMFCVVLYYFMLLSKVWG